MVDCCPSIWNDIQSFLLIPSYSFDAVPVEPTCSHGSIPRHCARTIWDSAMIPAAYWAVGDPSPNFPGNFRVVSNIATNRSRRFHHCTIPPSLQSTRWSTPSFPILSIVPGRDRVNATGRNAELWRLSLGAVSFVFCPVFYGNNVMLLLFIVFFFFFFLMMMLLVVLLF